MPGGGVIKSPDMKKSSTIAVIILFLLLYILPLGVRPIAIPDETRYAEIPREMIVSGDWVVPRLNGLKYFEKPVLGYWLNALSITLFGENAFAIRLTSALATGISALMVFFLTRRFGGGPQAGILAAAVYLTCLLVLALGVLSILDSMLSMFLTGAMASFFFAHKETIPSKRVAFLALFGLFCGLAFLMKGFLAFAVPFITILPFMFWERRFKELFKIAWVPILALLIVTLPWCIMIHLRESDFWNYFFWTEHIKRFISPVPGQHPKPFWYFLPVLAGGAFPWLFLSPAIFSEIRAAVRCKDPLIRFAICWVLFPFLVFSACSGKLIPYILPCFPPLVIIIAIGLTDYFEKGKKRAFNICTLSLAGLMGAIAVALVIGQTTSIFGFRGYHGSETWKWVVVVAGLLIWGTAAFFSAVRSGPGKKLALYAIAPLLLLFSGHFILPDHVMEDRAPEKVLLRNRDMVHPETIVVTGDHLVHAVCWFYKRDNIYLLETSGEHRYGLDRDHSNPSRLLTIKELREIINRNSGKNRVILIAEEKRYRQWMSLLPKPEFEDIDNGFVFLRF
ncbi:MAG: phospholipid carrier-dependent glycosyltransferase [Deltaproteobacteria bacterium]|nr:phospholipid carrier-dependent glycosyltransferase [Deltaproteobacteria bacterium]